MKIKTNAFRRINLTSSVIPVVSTLLIFYRRPIALIGRVLFGIIQSTGMMITYVFAIGSFFLWKLTRKNRKFNKSILVLLFMALLYILSLLFAPNNVANDYFKDYLIYCVMGSIIISFVDDYELMIKKYCLFSIVIFAFCAPLPFITGTISYRNMGYFSSGMAYGEWVILPCFYGFFLLYHYYHNKWALLFELVDLVLMILFANRSSLLSVAAFIILYDYIMSQLGKRVIGKWIVIALLAIISYVYLESFITEAQKILGIYGISSRALTKYLAFFQEGEVDISYMLSGRDSITDLAINFIKESPWFGIGVGTFYLRTGVVYTHNLVTDSLSTFGIFGGSFILFYSLTAIIQSIKKRENKILSLLLILLLVQCFPRLFLSKTFINDVPFWMFVVFSLSHYTSISFLKKLD